MAFAAVMRRSFSSSSPLLARFLNRAPNPGSPAASTLVIRSFSSSYYSSVADSNDETCIINAHGGSFARSEEFPIQRGIRDSYMRNPFQISGPGGAYEAKKVAEGLFVRMEMPGIQKKDVKVWVEYGNLHVKGDGKKESDYEDIGRTFSACLEVSSYSLRPESTIAEMKNGVLRMLIPDTHKFEGSVGTAEVPIF